MKWDPQYSTGIDALDTQHKMLFQMSEDYREALEHHEGQRTYGVMLESLDAYARGHFGREEQCMFQYQCPAAASNSEAHGQFIATLAGFRQRHAERGFVAEDAAALVDFIDGWLSSHIARIDAQLRPCVHQGARP